MEQIAHSNKLLDTSYAKKYYDKFLEETLKNTICMGHGKSKFQFKVKNILLIKAVISKDPKVLYNVSIFMGKKLFEVKALTYHALINNHFLLRFKKSIITNNP